MDETRRVGDSAGRSSEFSFPLTSRRGFIAAASLGAVSLYGLWAAFGAAPFVRLALDHDDPSAHQGAAGTSPAHPEASHGGLGAATGLTPEEFRGRAEEWIRRHQLRDGSVSLLEQGDPARTASPALEDMPASDQHQMTHPPGEMPAHGEERAAPDPASARPTDVYLMAVQWSYEPGTLRLRAGVPYRFRMMALDVSHGASLQLGAGSQIIRLRRNALVERELTFTRPGEYLLYCTIYCGIGHDRMVGRIIVT